MRNTASSPKTPWRIRWSWISALPRRPSATGEPSSWRPWPPISMPVRPHRAVEW